MTARLRIFLFLITAPFVLLAHLHPSSFFCLSLSPSCYITLSSWLSSFSSFFLQIISWLIFYIIFLSKQQVDGWPCAWVMVLLRIRLGHTVQIISFLDVVHEIFFLIFFLLFIYFLLFFLFLFFLSLYMLFLFLKSAHSCLNVKILLLLHTGFIRSRIPSRLFKTTIQKRLWTWRIDATSAISSCISYWKSNQV